MKILPTFYKNKHVLVTGGAGFIGSHITEKLLELGAHITVLDDLSTGSLQNLSPILHKIHLTVGDVSDYDTCKKATKHKDVIFHLAALVSVPESVKNPALCERINFVGTQNILETSNENKVKTLIYSSSSAVYGERDDNCNESDDTNPLSPYAEHKLNGEKLCKEFAVKQEMNTASLRYFNVYGERQSINGAYAAVVAKFKDSLKHKKPIEIYGDGKQTRDFVHVSKVVQANLILGTRPQLQGDVFNIGSGKSVSILELLKQLEKEEKSKAVDIIFKPARKGDIVTSKANCKKFEKLFEELSSF
jgi:nucleoside-diphosphate-sugar epimerase